MKKLLVLSGLVCALMMEIPAYAREGTTIEPSAEISTAQEVRSQEVEWVYRTYEGKLQKRLWSITEGVWLTGWIDC